MSSLETLKAKNYLIFGCGWTYVKTKTKEKENEIIKGIGLFLFHKRILTIAVANTLWTDDDDIPYYFKIEGNTLFIRKVAIGFGGNE